MINKLFNLCVNILLGGARLFGLTYEEVSVIVNLYVQGAVLALSGTIPAFVCVTKGFHVWGMTEILITAYAVINVIAFIALVSHYHLPVKYSFNLCVNDLMYIVKKYGISYNALNILIFVILWLAVLTLNTVLLISII